MIFENDFAVWKLCYFLEDASSGLLYLSCLSLKCFFFFSQVSWFGEISIQNGPVKLQSTTLILYVFTKMELVLLLWRLSFIKSNNKGLAMADIKHGLMFVDELVNEFSTNHVKSNVFFVLDDIPGTLTLC